MKKYYIILVSLTAILLFGSLYLSHAGLYILHPYIPVSIGFFFLLSIPIGWMLNKAKNNHSIAPIMLIGATGARLFTSLMLLVIFFYVTNDFNLLLIQFSVLYFIYFVFEITIALTNFVSKKGI